MSAEINKETVEHLAKLARLKLSPEEVKRLSGDLQKILGHFEELNKLDTSKVKPMTGGTDLKNIFREDEERQSTNQGKGKDQFPRKQKGYNRIPAVFE